MAKQKLSLDEFKALNPFCCFCGGVAPTFDRDHVPPRVAFIDRVGPPDFEFPSCKRCNHASRLIDQEFAFISMMAGFEDKTSPATIAYFESILGGVLNNSEPVATGMKMRSANEKRRQMKERGLPLPKGEFYATYPVVTVTPRAKQPLDILSFKLGCALHYKHFKRPLPELGKIASGHRTNVSVKIDGPLPGYYEFLIQAVIPKRGGKDLSKQFSYRYVPTEGLSNGFFVCEFNRSFELIIMTCEVAPNAAPEESEIPYVKDFLKNLGPL